LLLLLLLQVRLRALREWVGHRLIVVGLRGLWLLLLAEQGKLCWGLLPM